MQSNYGSLSWQGQDQQHKDKEEQQEVEVEGGGGLVWGANKQLMKYNNTNNTSIKHELLMDAESLSSSFKPMLEHDSNTSTNWYVNFINNNNTNDPSQFFQQNSQICQENHALLPPIESASSSYLSNLLSASGSNYPFESSVDFICDVPGFVEPFTEHPVSNLMSCGGFSSRQRFGSDLGEFPATHLVENASGSGLNLTGVEGFDTYGNISPLLVNRAKILRPNLSDTDKSKKAVEEGEGLARKGKEKKSDDSEMDGVDGLGLTSDSDELKVEENASTGGSISNLVVSGIQKGKKEKKKGQPAKNLMAERRRRKKLNDRLYMLRSVVPKISKMDRASILVDAIEYLKELLQRIKDLNDELQSISPNSSLPSATSFSPFNASATTLSHHVKEEASGSSLPNVNNQPPRVHVEVGEGSAFSIHMFCARRPGLLLSTIQALENLGVDIQQAVVSCINGFAMDVFKAEKCEGGLEVQHDQIKAALIEIAAYHGLM